jgi:hypothetical protein
MNILQYLQKNPSLLAGFTKKTGLIFRSHEN